MPAVLYPMFFAFRLSKLCKCRTLLSDLSVNKIEINLHKTFSVFLSFSLLFLLFFPTPHILPAVPHVVGVQEAYLSILHEKELNT